MKAEPELASRAGESAIVDLHLPLADSLTSLRASLLHSPAGQPAFADVFQQLINGLPEQIALLDEHWNILAVNDAWTRTAALYGYFSLRPGTNYRDFLREKQAEGHASATPVVTGIDVMEAGGQDSFRFLYEGSDRWEGHTFQLCVHRMEIGGRSYATVTRYDVTELMQLRQLREGYSHSLIEGQAEERRRIAREIHDSTMQLLAGLGLALGQLKRASKHGEALDIVADMEQLLGEAQGEIRAISYLAHPPALMDLGLPAALKALAEGYGRRTGLSVSLDLGIDEVGWESAKVAIYRVTQEALSNIHRHARATEVAVGLYRRRSMYHAVIADNGIGMPIAACSGVGLSSMRARVAELGGRLMVRHGKPGTTLIASLPTQSSLRASGDLAGHG